MDKFCIRVAASASSTSSAAASSAAQPAKQLTSINEVEYSLTTVPEQGQGSSAQSASSWLGPAPPPLPPQCENLVPIFEVAYNNGKWLPFPRDSSLAFYQLAVDNENARYATNTDKFREYVLVFGAMEQINFDNDRRR